MSTYRPGQVVTHRHTSYEVAAVGCDCSNCPNGDSAVTVWALDKHGERCWSTTQCIPLEVAR